MNTDTLAMTPTQHNPANVYIKRKRSDEDHEGEERPKKSLRVSQGSDKTIVEAQATHPVKQTDTGSTVPVSYSSLPHPTKLPDPASPAHDAAGQASYRTGSPISFSLDEIAAPVTSNFLPPEPIVIVRGVL